MQVLAEAGADVGLAAQPLDFMGLQLALAVDDAHVDLQAVLVRQKLFHAVIELEEWADQDQAIGCAFDQLFQVVVGAGGGKKFGHLFFLSLEANNLPGDL